MFYSWGYEVFKWYRRPGADVLKSTNDEKEIGLGRKPSLLLSGKHIQ
jgi:hypothetical protein